MPLKRSVPAAGDSGSFPSATAPTRIDTETMYKLGMLVQLIEDAGPDGLTLAQLGARTQLAAAELDRALRICVARGYLRRDGDRYKPKPQ